jgi:type III secretion protein U
VGLLLLFGAFDIGVQRWLFRRELRMTKSELKREQKDSHGNPAIKRWHRQNRGRSTPRTGLRNATFLIRSPDTVLALRYAAPDAMVPILVARGTQEDASGLLEEAKTLNLPVVFNAAVAAMIASRLKVGNMIVADMFELVIACMREGGVI